MTPQERLDHELSQGNIDEGDYFGLMMFAMCGGNAIKHLERILSTKQDIEQ